MFQNHNNTQKKKGRPLILHFYCFYAVKSAFEMLKGLIYKSLICNYILTR
jgi:hypothetical protein